MEVKILFEDKTGWKTSYTYTHEFISRIQNKEELMLYLEHDIADKIMDMKKPMAG